MRYGLRVRYASGAVRMNVLDGARSLSNDVLRQLGNEYGADGVELSAHALCAEDHLPWQGQQFSNKGSEQLQDTLDRPIGMWNCKHTVFPIIMGISEPAHSEAELEAYRKNSAERIEIDGVARSRYEWSQQQRRLEALIRQEKDVANLARASGDDVLRREAQAHINALDKLYGTISEKAGLLSQRSRMAVSGFRKVKTANSSWRILLYVYIG